MVPALTIISMWEHYTIRKYDICIKFKRLGRQNFDRYNLKVHFKYHRILQIWMMFVSSGGTIVYVGKPAQSLIDFMLRMKPNIWNVAKLYEQLIVNPTCKIG
jgi:hypothetical protein